MFDDEIFEDDESLIVSTKTEYDEIENVLRPKSMEGYAADILAMKNFADIRKNILRGGPGVGKSLHRIKLKEL